LLQRLGVFQHFKSEHPQRLCTTKKPGSISSPASLWSGEKTLRPKAHLSRSMIIVRLETEIVNQYCQMIVKRTRERC
jgi:hypothetical protein